MKNSDNTTEEEFAESDIEDVHVLFHPIRFRIYSLLKQEESLHVSEIARRLDEDRQLVTHHLMKLTEHGFLENEYVISEEPSSKGKAKKIYRLTDKEEEIKPILQTMLQ